MAESNQIAGAGVAATADLDAEATVETARVAATQLEGRIVDSVFADPEKGVSHGDRDLLTEIAADEEWLIKTV